MLSNSTTPFAKSGKESFFRLEFYKCVSFSGKEDEPKQSCWKFGFDGLIQQKLQVGTILFV